MANREGKATESDEAQPLLGATLNGRYKVLSLIARGGMGKVYRAEQSALGRVCALKVLSPHHEGSKDPEFHKRFFLEASTVARLQHPNTVTIFDYGKCEQHGVYYIAMEYLDGRTLHRLLHDERTLTEARAGHIAQQVCRSLHEAHRIGLVHRDLKPGNILLVERGDEPDFVKVLDFGLVKDVTGRGEDLTQTGLFMGSPKYMAPEQVLGTEISPRTDVYALGVMLYEMIAGKVPFDRNRGMSTLVAHVNEAPPPLAAKNPDVAVSAEMEAIVMRCLAKEPGDRFSSMKDLLAHLKRAAGDLSTTSESLPRAPIDYETAMGRAKRSEPPPRLSAPPPSISGTLRSVVTLPPAPSYNIVAPQTETGSGPQPGFGLPESSPRPSLGPPESGPRPPFGLPESSPRPSYESPASSPRPGSVRPSQPAPPPGRPSGRPMAPDEDPSGSISRPSARPGPKSDSLAPPQASRTFTGPMLRPAAPAWRPYAVAVLASLVGGGTAAVVLSRRPDEPRPERLALAVSASPGRDGGDPRTPGPGAVAIAVSPTAEPPRGPDVRILHIDSEPSGAVVADQGVQVCMRTPCEVYWPGSIAKLEHRLSLEKRGFRTAVLVVSPGDEKATVKLEAWALGEIAAAGGNPYGNNVEPLPPTPQPAAIPDPAATPSPTPDPPTSPPLTSVATTPAPASAIPSDRPPSAVATPVPAPSSSGPMHVEDVDTRPKRVSCAAPAWSREALEAKVSGTVVAKCTVTESGSLSGCRIIKGVPFMDGAVLAALATCKYTPAMAQGRAVAVDIPITLRLSPP